MKSVDFYNNSIIILSICAVLSCIIVYRIFLLRKSILTLHNIFYLGHIFLVTMLLFAVYSYVFLHLKFREEKKIFSKELWKADMEGRTAIVDHLIESHILNERLPTEVVILLGKPIRTYQEKNKSIKMAFYLGFRNRPFMIDPEFLIVEIKDGRVDRYYLKEGVPYDN